MKNNNKTEIQKKKYHYDSYFEQFFVDDKLPFDNKIHPDLRHLHRSSTRLKCNVCGFLSHANLHQDCCIIPLTGQEPCTGLMCGF